MLTGKHELILDRPYVNSAGFLGFAPDPHADGSQDLLGAFVTNPISVKPRAPAHPPRILHYPGGILLHTGHPNPGLAAVIKQQRHQWERATLPVLIHLLAEEPDSLAWAIQTIEQLDNVMGVELGLPPGIDAPDLDDFAQAALGELPFILRLPPEDAPNLTPGAAASGAAAISLGPPRGSLPDPTGRLVSGRLYGAATHPLVLETLARLGPTEIPIIAGGGVNTLDEAEAVLAAGASIVSLDSILWQPGGFPAISPG